MLLYVLVEWSKKTVETTYKHLRAEMMTRDGEEDQRNVPCVCIRLWKLRESAIEPHHLRHQKQLIKVLFNFSSWNFTLNGTECVMSYHSRFFTTTRGDHSEESELWNPDSLKAWNSQGKWFIFLLYQRLILLFFVKRGQWMVSHSHPLSVCEICISTEWNQLWMENSGFVIYFNSKRPREL